MKLPTQKSLQADKRIMMDTTLSKRTTSVKQRRFVNQVVDTIKTIKYN